MKGEDSNLFENNSSRMMGGKLTIEGGISGTFSLMISQGLLFSFPLFFITLLLSDYALSLYQIDMYEQKVELFYESYHPFSFHLLSHFLTVLGVVLKALAAGLTPFSKAY